MPTNYVPITSAPAIRGSSAPSSTPSTPSSTQVGDLIIAFSYVRDPNPEPVTVNVEAGWSKWFVREYEDTFLGGDFWFVAAYKIATVSGSQTIQPFTPTNTDGGLAPDKITGVIVFEAGTADIPPDNTFSNLVQNEDDPDESEDGLDYKWTSTISNAAPNPPSIVTPVANCMVLTLAFWKMTSAATGTITPPTGYTEAWEMSGSVNSEFSLAYKTVAGAQTTEDPGAYTDNITPTSTAAFTMVVRPTGWRTTVPVPVRGEKRSAAVCQPAWKFCADRDQWAFDRMPRTVSYNATGNPLWSVNTTVGPQDSDTNYNSSPANNYLTINDCVAGDKIFFEMSATYEFGSGAQNFNAGLYAIDDYSDTNVEGYIDGGQWTTQQTLVSPAVDPDKKEVRRHIKISAVHTVKETGRTRLMFRMDMASGAEDFLVYSFAMHAIRFPRANIANLPILLSINHSIADILGGDSLTITGENLASSTVTVGGTTATVTGTTSTTVTFTMPAKAAGIHQIVVTNANGSSGGLEIEAWWPGVLADVPYVAERPNYAATGGNGTWTVRKGGTNFTNATTAPTATSNTPNFDGVNDFLAGPTFLSLLDFGHPAGGGGGAFGCVVNMDMAAAQGATLSGYDNPMFYADNSSGLHGCGYSDRTHSGGGNGVEAYINTSSGYSVIRAAMSTGAYHSVLQRFQAMNGLDGNIHELYIDGALGAQADGVPGPLTDASSLTCVLGKNYNGTKFIDGTMRAFFFARVKLNGDFIDKFHRWSRCRHGVA